VVERHAGHDHLLCQCDGPGGRCGDLEFGVPPSEADLVVSIGLPVGPKGRPRARPAARLRAGRGRREHIARDRAHRAFERFGIPPERLWVLVFEPPAGVADGFYEVAPQHAARVYGPDVRAPRPFVLPVVWEGTEARAHLLAAVPPPKPTPLGWVTSGRTDLYGHRARLRFLDLLRRADVPLHLQGRGLPPRFGGTGPCPSKAQAMREARLALAVENCVEEPRYISEKLWDPLLGFALPLYYGSPWVERLIPAEAFVRLPDLDEGGVEVVRQALADPELPTRRMPAILEARRRALGHLRLVAWLAAELAAARRGDGPEEHAFCK
jgi:hypothetical protein